MEAGELGLFMFSACAFATLLRHPASPVTNFITSDVLRRVLMGFAMGTTTIAIVMSPWGKQSGAHFNPAVTLAFFWLGKVKAWDAAFYAVAQFLGAAGGVAIAAAALRGALAHCSARYAVTTPGIYGNTIAFVAEFAISNISQRCVRCRMSRSNESTRTSQTRTWRTLFSSRFPISCAYAR